MPHVGDPGTPWLAARSPPPRPPARAGPAGAPLTSDQVAAMLAFHPVNPLVTREQVNYPPESRIPDLVDLDLVMVSS
jgi:hypothetical protein